MSLKELVMDPWVTGIGTAVIAAVIIGLFTKKEKGIALESNSNSENHQEVTVNNYLSQDVGPSAQKQNGLHSNQIDVLKQDTYVLFIDDLDLKKKIKNLSDAGWKRVSQIYYAPNIDSQKIRDANIIFVDYKGIGEIGSKEQGLAVLSALRKRYGDKKYLILYTAHDVPIEAFTSGAHNTLSKNSTIYELEQKIIEGIESLQN